MKRLVWVGAGAAVGYVLGTKAGRVRYERFKDGVERVWTRVGGDEASQALSDKFVDLGDTVQARVADGVGSATEAAASAVEMATDKIRSTPVS